MSFNNNPSNKPNDGKKHVPTKLEKDIRSLDNFPPKAIATDIKVINDRMQRTVLQSSPLAPVSGSLSHVSSSSDTTPVSATSVLMPLAAPAPAQLKTEVGSSTPSSTPPRPLQPNELLDECKVPDAQRCVAICSHLSRCKWSKKRGDLCTRHHRLAQSKPEREEVNSTLDFIKDAESENRHFQSMQNRKRRIITKGIEVHQHSSQLKESGKQVNDEFAKMQRLYKKEE